QPKAFKMPEVMKDELTLEAESLLAHLENMYNLRGLLRNEISSYQEGNFTATELRQTLVFIRTKLSSFSQL
ncbi:MAG: hypothetical protein LPJ89_04225, partial [Hymenobacteraceae bacterium]|nr:hypothetical protein [Hymenobacteraceae bacterium]MDX5396267.1 hypothetical protein [Hymenobacteraceae bacterium]MDX5442971.1 hypothetical protein [Hymenobacteraceae bacterium]MDX5512328.1 hypothetical protein [Hymenobacteraceae bacterium]